jgi:heme/copper-type cytochrome/quinol oxidase subunit 3
MTDRVYLSHFLPKNSLRTQPRARAHGWELAAFGYAIAIWLYVLGYLIVALANLPGGFRQDLEVVFSRALLLAAPATVTAITLAARRRDRAVDDDGRWLIDAALTLTVPLGALFVLAGVVGFLAALGDFGTSASGTFYDLLIHLAGIVLGAVASLWALSELANMQQPAET